MLQLQCFAATAKMKSPFAFGEQYHYQTWTIKALFTLTAVFTKKWSGCNIFGRRVTGGLQAIRRWYCCFLKVVFFFLDCWTAIFHCGIAPQLQDKGLDWGCSMVLFTYMGEFQRSLSFCVKIAVAVAMCTRAAPCLLEGGQSRVVKTWIDHLFESPLAASVKGA